MSSKAPAWGVYARELEGDKEWLLVSIEIFVGVAPQKSYEETLAVALCCVGILYVTAFNPQMNLTVPCCYCLRGEDDRSGTLDLLIQHLLSTY